MGTYGPLAELMRPHLGAPDAGSHPEPAAAHPPHLRNAQIGGLGREKTAPTLGVSRKTVEKQVGAALKQLLKKLRGAE